MLELRALTRKHLSQVSRRVQDYFRKSPTHARALQLLLALERHNSLRTASAMAFDLFLAIVPMLGLAGYAASHLLRSQPRALVEGSRLLDLAPARLHGFIVRNVTAFSETEVAPLFVLLALWLSSSAFLTMIRVFEESFDCQPRSYLQARLLALAFAIAGLGLFVLGTAAGALVTYSEVISEGQRQQIDRTLSFLPRLVRDFEPLGALAFAASALGIALYLALIYRFAVVRRGKKRRYFPGAISATTIGLIGSFLLAYYVTNLGRYAIFYGSLAVIVVVLLWLWLWCSAILVGAEVNVAFEDAHAAQGIEPAGPTQMPSAIGKPDGD